MILDIIIYITGIFCLFKSFIFAISSLKRQEYLQGISLFILITVASIAMINK